MVEHRIRNTEEVANFLLFVDGQEEPIEVSAIGRSWRADVLEYVPADPDAVSSQSVRKENVEAIELSNDRLGDAEGHAVDRHRLDAGD